MNTIEAFVNWASVAISFVFCLTIVRKQASNVQKWLMLTFICGFVTVVGNTMEFYADSLEVSMTAVKTAYIGKVYMLLFALMFGVEFTNTKLPKQPFLILAGLDTICLTFIMTNDYHKLFYKSVKLIFKGKGKYFLVSEKGPLYYVVMGQMAICILAFAYLVIKGFRKASKESKIRALLLTSTAIIVLLLLAWSAGGLLTKFDPTTIMITIVEIIIMISVNRYGLLDTKQVIQESALEATQEGLILVDERKRLIYANNVARNLFENINWNDSNHVLDAFFKEREWVLDKDGRHYEARVSEVRDQKGRNLQGYIVWFFDMTFLNQYTNEMIRHKEASEQANKAKTNFMAHISHEIRTPLNAIIGYSELGLREREFSRIIANLKNIKGAANTLLTMMNEILDITKIESGKMELVEIKYEFDKLVQELHAMMEPQANKKGLQLTVELDERIPKKLLGDKGKIHEIMMNLISNAIKYTREGFVKLRISTMESTKNKVLLCIEVEDSGIGIEEENYDKIFEKFEQFDKEKNYNIQGSGLGLSITKSYIMMMEGDITVESEYGKGSKFTVTVWQGISDDENEDTEDALDSKIRIRSAKLLVVDDNELNCDVAQGILNYMGMDTDICLSGAECLKLLAEGNNYAMILTDHMMPEMDGVELMHRIRKLGSKYETMPIVLLTANAIAGVREKMLAEGFNEFLTKPIEIEELQKVLLKYLGQQ